MFRVINLAENAGYGFDKMINGWQSHYGTLPVVSGDIDNYRIEFFFEHEGLSGQLNNLLVLIKNNPGKNATQLSDLMDIPYRTLIKQIYKLLNQNLIERRGSKKTGGYWEVVIEH